MYFHSRYADLGDAPAGHVTDVGQRALVVLLCLLYIRHHRCSTVGWNPTQPMLP